MKKGYKASVTIIDYGETEDIALDRLADDIFELDRRISAGEEPMEIKIEECEIDGEEE